MQEIQERHEINIMQEIRKRQSQIMHKVWEICQRNIVHKIRKRERNIEPKNCGKSKKYATKIRKTDKEISYTTFQGNKGM